MAQYMRSQTPQDTVESPQGDLLFHSLPIYKVAFQPVNLVSSSSTNGLEHHLVLIPQCKWSYGRSRSRGITETGFQPQPGRLPWDPLLPSFIPIDDQQGNGLYFSSFFFKDQTYLFICQDNLFSSNMFSIFL